MQARSTSDVTLLVISKFDYEELVHNYPEQNDVIVTNVLSLFGLDKDGNDSSVTKDSADTISDDAKEKLRCAMLHTLLHIDSACCILLYQLKAISLTLYSYAIMRGSRNAAMYAITCRCMCNVIQADLVCMHLPDHTPACQAVTIQKL